METKGIVDPRYVYVVLMSTNVIKQSEKLEEVFDSFVDEVYDNLSTEEVVMEWRHDADQSYVASLLEKRMDAAKDENIDRYKTFYDGINSHQCGAIKIIVNEKNLYAMLSRLENRSDILYVSDKEFA